MSGTISRRVAGRLSCPEPAHPDPLNRDVTPREFITNYKNGIYLTHEITSSALVE
jgi:hypothetical protein